MNRHCRLTTNKPHIYSESLTFSCFWPSSCSLLSRLFVSTSICKLFTSLKCWFFLVVFFHSPLDNAEGRLSASPTKCAEGVPGKWTDQVLYIRQPNHCAGKSRPRVLIKAGKRLACNKVFVVMVTESNEPKDNYHPVLLLQYAPFKLQLGS